MKSIFALTFLCTLILAGSLSFAADKVVEIGTYTAVDVESGEITATLEIRENKTINLLIAAPDFEMPKEGCEGDFKVKEYILTSHMKCPLEGFEEMDVIIDITTVNSESVRSPAGAMVDVIFAAFGDESSKFVLRKIK